jgi:serine/threonine protein kinase/Flp pilus assembly protein TadD
LPGALIGSYKLIEQIGEGGMGTVWMAQQTEPVKRLVAIKLIKAGMDSRQVIARFEAERQALALMDHTNIARVLEAGTTDAGRPYFVMDLVKGVPITRYCDEHHLTPRQRLGLFIPVCQAVQHAHQKGIIHRDLKPSNVLVALYDGKPVPKVIDFGVAKAAGQSLTEKTLVTGFGNLVGTLEYMSPEQAEINQLDIDTRSDIYSLGVLLYELLTGTTPFTKKDLEKAGMVEMLRVIREQEPSKPSTKLSTAGGLPTLAANRGMEPAKLTRLVRGELDWIVMKALEKERSRRYETANGLAADAQRYLNDEPVQACPPSTLYRMRKFARRNKGGLAGAALVLFLLVLLGSGVGWTVHDRSAREAETARQHAERQAKLAGQVESIVAEVDRLAREQKWPESLAAARRAEAAVAGGEPDGETAQRVRMLLKDLQLINRLEQIRMEKAADSSWKQTDREYARAFRDYGVDVEEWAVESSVERLKARPALAIPLAAALDDWASLRPGIPEAEASGWKRLVAVARGIDPEPMRDRLRSTWGRPALEARTELRRLAESIDIRAHHPATLESLAHTLQRVELPDSAIRILREAQAVYPGDYWLNSALASALSQQKDFEGAIRFFTVAASLRPHTFWDNHKISFLLLQYGKFDEAGAVYRRNIGTEPKRSGPSIHLAGAPRGRGKLDEAILVLNKAIELDPTNSSNYFHLALALRAQEKLDQANAAFDKAIELYRKAIELNPRSADAWFLLGNGLRVREKWEEAIAAFRKAIDIDPKLSLAHDSLAWILATRPETELRDSNRAVALAKRAVELKPEAGYFWNTLGAAQYRAGDWKAAVAALEKSMDLRNGGENFDWFFLAMAQWQLGEKDKAREWYERAVQSMDKNQPDDNELRRLQAESAELMELNKK